MSLNLSPREHECATLLVQGLSNREIGLKLDISHQTVKNILTSVYKKLGLGETYGRKRVKAVVVLLNHL